MIGKTNISFYIDRLADWRLRCIEDILRLMWGFGERERKFEGPDSSLKLQSKRKAFSKLSLFET